MTYWLDRQAADAYKKADAAYARYCQSMITSDADQWRQEAERLDAKGDDNALKRNLAAGVSAGSAGLSLVLFAVSF